MCGCSDCYQGNGDQLKCKQLMQAPHKQGCVTQLSLSYLYALDSCTAVVFLNVHVISVFPTKLHKYKKEKKEFKKWPLMSPSGQLCLCTLPDL